MSERSYRIIQGIYLLIALYFDLYMMIYIFVALFAFEGITNWRLPILVTRIRNNADLKHDNNMQDYRFYFEAERMLRIAVVLMLIFTIVIFPEQMWFFPWFIAVMLFLAGITKVCPMVMFFQYLGFR